MTLMEIKSSFNHKEIYFLRIFGMPGKTIGKRIAKILGDSDSESTASSEDTYSSSESDKKATKKTAVVSKKNKKDKKTGLEKIEAIENGEMAFEDDADIMDIKDKPKKRDTKARDKKRMEMIEKIIQYGPNMTMIDKQQIIYLLLTDKERTYLKVKKTHSAIDLAKVSTTTLTKIYRKLNL
jgi:hypothetical protein